MASSKQQRLLRNCLKNLFKALVTLRCTPEMSRAKLNSCHHFEIDSLSSRLSFCIYFRFYFSHVRHFFTSFPLHIVFTILFAKLKNKNENDIKFIDLASYEHFWPAKLLMFQNLQIFWEDHGEFHRSSYFVVNSFDHLNTFKWSKLFTIKYNTCNNKLNITVKNSLVFNFLRYLTTALMGFSNIQWNNLRNKNILKL